MELSDFTGKPCSSRVAFQFLPNKPIELDLLKVAQDLKKENIVEMESKVLLILKIDGKNVSLFQSGKTLVRGEKDENSARAIAERVVKFI
jgi:TATA-box binding protein (TBP) (component of TFIID and TFIIIB)